MTIDPQSPDLSLGVIGTGTMGRGIAQIAYASGKVVVAASVAMTILAFGLAYAM